PSQSVTSVIIRDKGNQLPAEFKKYARPGMLTLVNAFVLDVPNSQLKTIASHANTLYANHNATVHAFNFRTGVQSGAFFARRMMGITGAGVGVVVMDSGVAPNKETKVTFFQDFLVAPKVYGVSTDAQCAPPCDAN